MLLFQPARIGSLELRNRLVMSPMHVNLSDGDVNDRLIDFYVERAQGEVGLIIVSVGCVDPAGMVVRGFPLYDDKIIPSLAKLADKVHEFGARIGLHIVHGGKNSFSRVTGMQAVSPSAIISSWTKEMPRELTRAEIKEIVEKFAQAVRRIRKAGFDVVEFNAYSAYLIREFLSPSTNKREDEYGGDLKNRFRFFQEVIEKVQEVAGKDFPLICRISGNEYIPEGNTLAEAKFFARELTRLGVTALHVSPGGHDSTVPLNMGFVPKGAFVYLAEAIKKEVAVPVITAHIGDVLLAEKVIREGKADLIAIGRGLLADPDLPRKAREGRFAEINYCCRCLQGCFERVLTAEPVTCLSNPAVGKEREFAIEPALKKKKIVVIGGGPAGMEAARVCALRGHEVVLYEKKEELGGQLRLASVPPGKEDFRKVIDYLAYQLKQSGVKLFLNREATPKLIAEENPAVVIMATGGKPIIPDLPGITGEHVVTAHDVLKGKDVGKKVVIIGGGGTGCDVALYLAEKGNLDPGLAFFLISWGALATKEAISLNNKGFHEITIVEMLPAVGSDLGVAQRGFIRRLLTIKGVKILTRCEVKAITPQGVSVTHKDGESEEIAADTVVIAVGVKSENALYQQLQGKIPEVILIGDANKPGKAFDAIHEAAVVARKI